MFRQMIGITIGDPNGVGPEILLRAYDRKKLPESMVAIGDHRVLQFCNETLRMGVPLHVIKSKTDCMPGVLNMIDVGQMPANEITIGKISKSGGKASLEYIREGASRCQAGELSALVTLPVNKEAIRLTMRNFSGHTGFIASLCKVSNYSMMLVTDRLIVTHISTHISLKEAINQVRKQRVLDVIRLTDGAVKKIRRSARIAVAGLNPHAGEGNAFGNEDSREIRPAVEAARGEGLDVKGPLPADTVFYQAAQGFYDAVVCMYHDQGHIPVKLLDFEGAVNVTLGLPFVRTSVDHGTAYDIAYKGTASIQSLVNACRLANQLS